jgi:hypothetical protein
MSVPRHIFQGWIGDKPMPDREKRWCEQMGKMNPGWSHYVFGNEILEKYGSDTYVKALLDLGKPKAFVVDRIRMLLLRDEGGVWLDPDAQPIRPLDSLNPLWDGPSTFIAGFRSPDRPDVALHRGVTLLDNTFLASAPNSRMCQRILSLWRPQNVVIDGHAVGVEILRNCHSDVTLLNHRYFYATQIHPETIALHDSHNLASWVQQTRKSQSRLIQATA